jgi:hypothetical protein
VVDTHQITDDDLRSLLRLGATPEMLTAGFSVARIGIYARKGVPLDQAEAWERVVADTVITDADLDALIHAGFTPEDAMAAATDAGDNGVRLGEAARTLEALTPKRDPWRSLPAF